MTFLIKLVQKYQCDKHHKGVNSWTDFVSMLFCHLSSADSVRDISNGLRNTTGNMSHMGISISLTASPIYPAVKEIEIQYIQPGRLMQNGYIERINRTFRESILDAYLFTQQVQILAEEWIKDYNYKRTHESLGGKTPMEYDTLPAAYY